MVLGPLVFSIYFLSCFPGYLVQSQGFKHHLCVDYSQMYDSCFSFSLEHKAPVSNRVFHITSSLFKLATQKSWSTHPPPTPSSPALFPTSVNCNSSLPVAQPKQLRSRLSPFLLTHPASNPSPQAAALPSVYMQNATTSRYPGQSHLDYFMDP